jgi:hypothetical protein
MNEGDLAKYEQLKQELAIDLVSFDDDFMKMPNVVQEAAEFAADLLYAVLVAKQVYDVTKVDAGNRLRTSKVPSLSETAVAAQLQGEADVQEARLAYDKAQRDSEKASALVADLRLKSHNLQKISEMIMAGYITPSSAYVQQRKERGRAS